MMLKSITKALCSVALLALANNALAAKSEPWLTDMAQARKVAKTEGKDIFMFFTGSDWCGWCIRLDNEVLSKQQFLTYAKDNLVLVELDFPHNQELLTEKQKAHNEQWKKRFPIQGFPTVFITDDSANRYAETGYRDGGPAKYIEHLQQLKTNSTILQSVIAKANNTAGLKRAKLLDEALNLEGAIIDNSDELMTEIIELSKADQALNSKYVGIKGNKNLMKDMQAQWKQDRTPEETLKNLLGLYDEYGYLREGQPLGMLVHFIGMTYNKAGQPDNGIAFMDKVISDTSYAAEFRQGVGITKAFMTAEAGNIEAATATLDQAVALAPESDMARNRDHMLKQLESISGQSN